MLFFLNREPEVDHGAGEEQCGLFSIGSAGAGDQRCGIGAIGDLLPEIDFPGKAEPDGESIGRIGGGSRGIYPRPTGTRIEIDIRVKEGTSDRGLRVGLIES